MKEWLWFPLTVVAFVIVFAAFYITVNYWNFSGLASLMLCALPVIAFIALATADKPKDMIKSFGVIAFWFYAVLLACAGIAALI